MKLARLLPALMLVAFVGCVSDTAPIDPDSDYLSRSVSRSRDGIAVTASVLDGNEIEGIFGSRLDRVGVQPVWLRIENLSAYGYILLLRSIDPDYFSPYEVARRATTVSDKSIDTLYPFVRDLEIQRFLPPGARAEGFVFTHLDEGLKAINVEFVGNRTFVRFNMAVRVPGLRTDFDDFDAAASYSDRWLRLDERELREWLSLLPCCTRAENGVLGDPLNLVFVGEIEDIRAALVGQHWDVTEEVTAGSLFRLFGAFVSGSRYRYAPISSLYLFGRPQDITFQKSRLAIEERNHIRLWAAPVSFQGRPVWVGHVSRDAGVKFSHRFWPPTTHVIDPAVDEARFYVEQDLLYSRRIHKIGLVDGVGAAPVDAPRTNVEGDPYFTDGRRAVFFIGQQAVPLEELEVLDWSLPPEFEPFRDSMFGQIGDDEERRELSAPGVQTSQ